MQGYRLTELQDFIRTLYAQPAPDGSGRVIVPDLYIAPFGYPLTFTSIAAVSGQSTQQLAITANADFVALYLSHHANIAAAAQTVSNKTAPMLRCLIVDNGTNEQWWNAAVDLENVSMNGVGQRPLPFPRLVQGKSSLTVTLTSYAAAEVTSCELFIGGVLVKRLSQRGVM
jgi:hypothetical protein